MPSLQHHALLINDSQRWRVDPTFDDPAYMSWTTEGGMMKPNGTEQTRAVAERIRDMADKYRDLGVPVFIICYAFDDEDHTNANGGLYMVEYKPERGDIMVRKEEMSPFLHSDVGGKNIDTVLRQRGIKTLSVAGFHASLCITDLTLDALDKKYEVRLLEDCIGENDPHPEFAVPRALEHLEKNGALRVTSIEDLAQLHNLREQESVPVFDY